MDYINKSLEELEAIFYRKPASDSSGLIRKIYTARKKKLSEYTVEDLRLLIGQMQGLDYLIPLALVHLENNPFTEGDYYEGDLLKNVLECDCEFWKRHLKEAKRMDGVIRIAYGQIDGLDILPNIKSTLLGLMEQYQLCFSETNSQS